MKKRKLDVIICPYCGQEYLPNEIFIPNAVFGKVENIERDFEGKILDVVCYNPDLNESYICDKCNNTFNVQAKINFLVSPTKIGNIEEEYSVPLRKNKNIELDEE